MTDLIRRVRLNVSSMGGSELKAVASNEGLQDLWKQRQELVAEMNAAKRKALQDAEEPYRETLAEIDRMYGMMLQFAGDNGEEDA